jgi:hypothetical protein
MIKINNKSKKFRISNTSMSTIEKLKNGAIILKDLGTTMASAIKIMFHGE